MKTIFIKVFIVVFIFSLSENVYSQVLDTNSRFLSAIVYLRTDSSINAKIKAFFKKVISKREKYPEFNLSPRLSLLGIKSFADDLTKYQVSPADKYVDNTTLYLENFGFKPVESDFLKKIGWVTKSQLYLTFSKPIENYLVAEMTSTNPVIFGPRKFGVAMQFFFEFDESGIVKQCFTSGCIYN